MRLRTEIFSIILFLVFLAMTSSWSQNQFVYEPLDQKIISLWLSDPEQTVQNADLFEEMYLAWTEAKQKIRIVELRAFNNESFIQSQEHRLQVIKSLLWGKKVQAAQKECWILLNEFRDIRQCFTQDDYLLDNMLETYHSYQRVHEIVHDQMMGLYEWTEFIWFVDQLRCDAEMLDYKMSKHKDYQATVLVQTMDKVNDCLFRLNEAIETAFQSNFELPCDETGKALETMLHQFSKLFVPKI